MISHPFTGKASSIVVAGALIAAVVGGGLGYPGDAHADRQVRGGARTSVNHTANANVNRNANVNQNANVNRNANVNQNVNVNRNVNVNQNVNVNRNVNVSGGRYNDDYHPVATAAAIGATVAVTSAVVGSMVRTLPPSCAATVVNGVTYQNCGGAWYQPQYSGSQVTYVVVNAPG